MNWRRAMKVDRPARFGGRGRGLTSESTALADAFADDPWAKYVLGTSGHRRQQALARLMSVPVACAAMHGGVVTIIHDTQEGHTNGDPNVPHTGGTAAVGAWVPSGARKINLRTAVQLNAVSLPLDVGLPTMRRLWRDEVEVDQILNAHLTDQDAYLWVLGVRRREHGHGMGRRLVDQISRNAARSGHHRILLHTDTPGNVEIYRRLGFNMLEEQLRTSGLRCHVLAMPLESREHRS